MAKHHSSLSDEWGAFTGIPNQFIDNSRQFSDHARWLFVLLRRYTNGESGKAFPGYDFLQECTGWSPKTIAKAIKELIENGWMSRQKRFGKPSEYILKRPAITSPREETQPSISSRREVQFFPTGSTFLPDGKTNKIETKKTEPKKIESVSAVPAPAISHTPQTAVEVACEIFPMLPIYSQEVIDNADITKIPLWRKACEDWRSNRYSTRNITGLIDSYYRLEKQHSRDEDYRNGTNGQRTYKTAGERAAHSTIELARRLAPEGGNGADSALPGFEWFDAIAGLGHGALPANLDADTTRDPRRLTDGQLR